MHALTRAAPGRTLARLDAAIILLIIVLSGASLSIWFSPRFPGLEDARALDITINVAAIMIGAAVAILAWIRWRDTGETVALYESSAFVALTAVNALMIGIVIIGKEADFGLAASTPGEAPIYLWTVTRAAVAAILIIGAARSLRRESPPLPPVFMVLAPAGVLIASGLMLFAREPSLPPVPGAEVFGPGGTGVFGVSPMSTAIVILQVAIFVGFIVAAILLRRLYIRDALISDAYLAAGLVVAAFSQLHFALDPVVAAGVVTSTDALRLVFYLILVLGIQAEIGADFSALRRANAELRRLREVDAANATMAERTRLAREIHDGLAQDLWYAKLKQGRLTQNESLDTEAKTTAGEVLNAIDSALAEARQAVMAMRVDPSAESSLEEVLRSYVEDFSDRFGVRAEFEADGTLPRLPPRTEAEVLRIVQEALNNVRRHADATVVRVRTEREGAISRISVTDNGRGFDPSVVPPERYGLRGMRERADLVGASLEIRSRPKDGTRISVEVTTEEVARA
ncbi:MAG: sensor histidine kinase [Chloroflexota bacterium]